MTRDEAIWKALCHSVVDIGDATTLFLASLTASGYAVVPIEATLTMLDDGHRAYTRTHRSGVSGMSIEAQTRAECCCEAACWSAMLGAIDAELNTTEGEVK